jgi:hypothetical protein
VKKMVMFVLHVTTDIAEARPTANTSPLKLAYKKNTSLESALNASRTSTVVGLFFIFFEHHNIHVRTDS